MESGYTVTSSGDPVLFATTIIMIFMIMFLPLLLLVVVPALIGLWKLFSKAGQPGWAAIVPIYNTLVLLKIVGRPAWWIVLLFIPIVSLVVSLAVFVDLARAFGKDVTFGLLTWLFSPVMLIVLGFSQDAEYIGPVAKDNDMFSGFHDTSPQSATVTPPLPPTPPAQASAETTAPSAPPVPPAPNDQHKSI